MSGPIPTFAELAWPSPHDVLAWGAPALVLAALGWLVLSMDRVMRAVFPHSEWEQSLGWLNIIAEKRAARAMRWVGYGVVILLLDALVGIFWAAKGMPRLADWSDPWVMGELALRVPALGFCLMIWVIYLGLSLLPRLRAQREAAAYRQARKEMRILEEESAPGEQNRVQAALSKPRGDAKTVTLTPKRHWRQHPPGG